METNFIGRNNNQFSSTKPELVDIAPRWRIILLIQLLQLQQHLWGWTPQISPSKPMQQKNGGKSLLNSLLGAHARVLDTLCQIFFCIDLRHHISNVLISVDLSYLEQLFFISPPDPMISHIYVLHPCMIHSVLA